MISPESQGGPNIGLITIVCGWTFLVIALIGVSLMLWNRQIIKQRLSFDEYLTILALAMTIALVGQTTWAIVDEGQANHEAEVPKKKFALAVRSLLVNETLWGVVNTLVRMSAISVTMRIFGTTRLFRWIARSLLVISILYGVVVFLEIFLICRPMAVDWNASVDGTCGHQILAYLVLEAFGLLLDFAIIVVPIWGIRKLRMEPKRKIPFILTFSIGVLVFIVTGLRLQALHMVNAQDFTYSKGYLGLLSAIGASLAVFFCCAPQMVGLYRRLRKTSLERKTKAVANLRKASLERKKKAVAIDVEIAIDVETTVTTIEDPDGTYLPLTEDCAANANPPPYGGLRRNHTF